MKEIPRFSLEEIPDITFMLNDEGIPHESRGVSVGVSAQGATTEYIIQIPDEFYEATLELIGLYYGIHLTPDSDAYSGICPACTSQVNNLDECPECGLSLSYSPEEANLNHPFAQYLKNIKRI